MLSLTLALLTLFSYQGDNSENVLNSRVVFAYDLQNVTVSDTVRKMREYRIPISFIQSEESTEDSTKHLSVRVKNRTLREFLLDIVSQAKGYKFGIIENHLILYPSEKNYENVVDTSFVGTRNRIDAISEFLSALKEQIRGFDDLRRPVLNNPEYFTGGFYTEPISMPPRTTVLNGFMQVLGRDPHAILTIKDRQIRLDLIKPLKGLSQGTPNDNLSNRSVLPFVGTLSRTENVRSTMSSWVQKYSLKANSFLEALTTAAGDFTLPMGVEWTVMPDNQAEFTHSWDSCTVEQIFSDIVRTQPGYEIHVRNGVLHVLAPKLIPDRQNFLKLRIGRFRVNHEPFEIASAQLHNYLNDIIYEPRGRSGSIASMGNEPKLDLDMTNARVEEVLDEIVLASTRKIWVVIFAGPSFALTRTGYRRTLLPQRDSSISDDQQPNWDLFRWGEALNEGYSKLIRYN